MKVVYIYMYIRMSRNKILLNELSCYNRNGFYWNSVYVLELKFSYKKEHFAPLQKYFYNIQLLTITHMLLYKSFKTDRILNFNLKNLSYGSSTFSPLEARA